MTTELEPSEAIRHAKRWLSSVYVDEKIENLGLEEVRFDGGKWEITLGFDRFPVASHNPSTWAGLSLPRREYKVVVLSAEDGAVVEMRNREPVIG